MKYIHLIRHGATEGNLKAMFYGNTDLPLSREGESSIDDLTKKGLYPNPEKAVYYTSGLLRTEQTLSLIYGNKLHTKLGKLKEINFGDFELKTHEELQDLPEYISWINANSEHAAPPGGESIAEFKNRVLSSFDLILASDEEHSVVVCHGGVIGVIMAKITGDEEDVYKWIPNPGYGYTITFVDGNPAGFTSFKEDENK